MGVPCWVDDALNSSLMIWLDSNFARVFLCGRNQDVGVTSPQPQPMDDIAGTSMRAVPWDDSPPRAVQVVSRHRAIDLMPLLCRNRQERRCNPPFSTRKSMLKSCAASGKQLIAVQVHSLWGGLPCGPWQGYPRNHTSRRAWSVTRASDQSSCVASKGAKPFKLGSSSLHGPR
jgi:hypothetical protein